MPKLSLVICMLTFFLSSAAHAGIQPDRFTVSPLLGGHIFDGNQSREDAFLLGIGLGYNLTEHAALEAVYSHAESNADDATTTDAKVRTYRLDALYHFRPESSLVPYLAIGGGRIHTNPAGPGSEDHWIANYGGGMKIFINDRAAIRVDVRHLLDFPGPDNNLLYSAGLFFQIGAPAAPPEPADIPSSSAWNRSNN